MRLVLADSNASLAARREALAALLKAKDPTLAATLHSLVRNPGLSGVAIRALSAYDDPATPDVLIAAYGSLGPAERRDVLNTLAAPNARPRRSWRPCKPASYPAAT